MPSMTNEAAMIRAEDIHKRFGAGEVLKGVLEPWECKVFGTACTPRTPLGATMVSSEGACAAYYHFRRLEHGAGVRV